MCMSCTHTHTHTQHTRTHTRHDKEVRAVEATGSALMFATEDNSAMVKRIKDHVVVYSGKAWIKQNVRFSQWVDALSAKINALLTDFLKSHLTAIIQNQMTRAQADDASARLLQVCMILM